VTFKPKPLVANGKALGYRQVYEAVTGDGLWGLDEPAPPADPWGKVEAGLRRIGIALDPWQLDLSQESARQVLVCCSRQSGKSQTAAVLALKTALTPPELLHDKRPATVLLISRAQRQSAELLRKVRELYRAARGERLRKSGKPWRPLRVRQWQDQEEADALLSDPGSDSVLTLELANGARVISLPGTHDTIVGYSAITLLVIDEAARTGDDLYRLVRPMLAVSHGQLVALSTPFGKRGWFWEAYNRCEDLKQRGVPEETWPWRRYVVKAEECPRIMPDFLEEERIEIGERWFRQEYLCSFEDTVEQVFSHQDIHSAVSKEITPLDL
jgi:hypothetical protein